VNNVRTRCSAMLKLLLAEILSYAVLIAERKMPPLAKNAAHVENISPSC
jgi:hypothetical protein